MSSSMFSRVFSSTSKAFADVFHQDNRNARRKSTRRNRLRSLIHESLEMRALMAANPVAQDDSAFYTTLNTDLVVTTSSSPAHPAANDLDIDSSSLTYSVLAGPSSGSLISYNTNGTFTYRPNISFTGVDSFTYVVSDGTNTSNAATVTIAVGTKLLGKQNLDSNLFSPLGESQELFKTNGLVSDGAERSNITLGSSLNTNGSLAASGGLQLLENVTPDQSLAYRSNSLIKPIIMVDTQLAPGISVPSAVSAQLTFNGTAGTTYSYSTAGFASSQAMHFAIQADGSALATGMYDYTLAVTLTISGTNYTQNFTGKQAIVNRTASEFGAGWWLDGLDRIVDSGAGALLVKGNGDTLWFPKSGGNYLHAGGDVEYHTLVKNGGGTFTLTSKTGITSNFSALGLLTSIVDTNGNTTSFGYSDQDSDSVSDELVSITDPFNRVTDLNYTSGKVSSIDHHSGRTTTFSYSSGNLSGYTLPDPDGAGALSPPAVSFSYSSGNLTGRTNPVSEATAFAYGASDGRLRTVTYASSATWQLVPSETVGLPTGTSGNTLRKPVDVKATITDQRSNAWYLRTDRFGGIVESTTALGYVRTALRNFDGLPYVVNDPDPDGAGPLTTTVTYFGYDDEADLTHVIAPDGGVTVMTYSSSLNRMLTKTDPLSRTILYTYDGDGNLTDVEDPAGFVTTFAYNALGLPTSMTTPDPDGVGGVSASVTGYAYDSYGLLATLTNPDSSTQTFTYNSADQRLTAVDELGETTTSAYDSLGRLTSVTNRVSAQVQYEYDAMSRVIKIIDPLSNETDIAYNNRGWVSSVTHPDPDGGGSLASAVDTRTYDAAGNLTSSDFAGNNYATAVARTYDNDNRLLTQSDPDSASVKESYAYDNQGRQTIIYRANTTSFTGNRTVVTYDAASRVTNQKIQNSSGSVIYSSESKTYNAAGEVTSKTDGRGNATSYTYNSRGLLETVTLPDPDGAGSQFGLVVTYDYDNMGRNISIDRGFNRVTTYEYNNRSWVTDMTEPDPDGAGVLASPVTQYGYNNRGDRTTVTGPLGNVTTTAYDDEQRPTSVTLPDPDGVGGLSSPVFSTAYNAANWVTSQTDALGGVTSYTYDNLGRVLTKTDPDPDGVGGLSAPVTTNTYDSQGLWKVTDALTRITEFARDGQGRVTSVTDPLSNVTTKTYDYYGNITSTTDPDPDGGGVLTSPYTSYAYDPANRLTTKTDAITGVTGFTYDATGNLTSITDPVSNTTNFGYDGWNRKVIETNELSNSRSFVFDVAGNLTRTVDRNGRVVQYQYDDLDRLTTELWQSSGTPTPTLTVSTSQQGGTYNEQQTVGWTFSGFNSSVSGSFTLSHNGQTTGAIAWNASASTIQTALEALSTIGSGNVEVVSTVPPGAPYSRTISLTFKNGLAATNVPQTTLNVSTLMGDTSAPSVNNATQVTGGTFSEVQSLVLANASGGTWRVAYNGEVSSPLSPTINAGQLETALESFTGIDDVTVSGSSGSFTVTFGGSQANTNVLQIFGDAANATSGSTIRTLTTVYDAASRVISQSDPSSTIDRTLDNLGRATSIEQSVNGFSPSVTFGQAFDAMNNRLELNATVGSTLDFDNTYTYDALHRLTDIVQQSQGGGSSVTSKHASFAYNSLSQRTNISRYQSTSTTNGVAITDFTYDSGNRLSTISHEQGLTTLNDYSYSYDNLSRITAISQATDGSFAYTYDATGQLIKSTHSGQPNEENIFDVNGNRTGIKVGRFTLSFVVDTNNLTSEDNTYYYTYDDEGNLIARQEKSTGKIEEYTWDYRNRLIQAVFRNTLGGAIVKQVDYEYDMNQRLVRRTYDADGAGVGAATDQFWAYDDGINAQLEFDGASGSDLTHRYLWSNGIDDLLADEQVTSLGSGGNTLWGLADHQGTIRDIADLNEGSGVTSVTNHRKYSSNGKLLSESNSAVDLLFSYTGKQYDEATRFQHNLNRWYSPENGQWISEDPIGFEAGDANIRRYAGNGGVNRRDPDGRDWLDNGANFFAGWADVLTLGATDRIREEQGWNGGIDHGGNLYAAGRVTGAAVGVAAGAGVATGGGVVFTVPTISVGGGGATIGIAGGGTLGVGGGVTIGTTTVAVSGEVLVGVGVGGSIILTQAGGGSAGGGSSNPISEANPQSLLSRQGPREMNNSQVESMSEEMMIGQFPWRIVGPIEVAEGPGGVRIIIDGHHRAMAAIEAGLNSVPIRVQAVSPERWSQLMQEVLRAGGIR